MLRNLLTAVNCFLLLTLLFFCKEIVRPLFVTLFAGPANLLPGRSIGVGTMSSYALALGLVHASAADDPQNKTAQAALFPVRQNGKFGYIDRAGEIVIEPRFDYADRFSDGLALVKVGGENAYVNETGKVVIKLDYKDFNIVSRFSEGMAVVGNRAPGDFIQDRLGYIDKMGKLVIPLQFDQAHAFSDGLAMVSLRYKRGYIDKAGKFVIEPQFGVAESFSDGLARVGSYVQGLPQEHYIDRTGKRAIRQNFRFIDDFSEGLAAVWIEDEKGYIDRSGALVIKPRPFDAVSKFSDGLAQVQAGGNLGQGGRLGFIDTSGKMVIQPHYEHAKHFSEGVCAVRIGEKYGYIDKTGGVVIEPKFYNAEAFRDGLAAVWIDSRMGYIDKTGKYVWEPTY